MCIGPISDRFFCPFGPIEIFACVAGKRSRDLPLGWRENSWRIGGIDIGVNNAFEIIPAGATAARKTLLNLADIFRYSLSTKQQLVSLADEIDIVEAYLQIERLRLSDRLTTRIEIDERVRFSQVPALSIQPLVENAVKHGVSRKADGGEVRVSAREDSGGLRVEVADNGPGFETQAQRDRGHGLRSVERRLQLCYEGAVEFRVESDASGARVGFTIPAAAQ